MSETSATFHEISVWDEDTLTYYFHSDEVNSKLKSTSISKSDSNLLAYASLLVRFIIFYLSKKNILTRYEGFLCINQEYESKWYHINKKLFQNFINFCVAIGFFEEKKGRSNNQYIKPNIEFIFSILDEKGEWKKEEKEERNRAKDGLEDKKKNRRKTIVQNNKKRPETADIVFNKFKKVSQEIVDNDYSRIELQQKIDYVEDKLGYSVGDLQLLVYVMKTWKEKNNSHLQLNRVDYITFRPYFCESETLKFMLDDTDRKNIRTAIFERYDSKSYSCLFGKPFGYRFNECLKGGFYNQEPDEDTVDGRRETEERRKTTLNFFGICA